MRSSHQLRVRASMPGDAAAHAIPHAREELSASSASTNRSVPSRSDGRANAECSRRDRDLARDWTPCRSRSVRRSSPRKPTGAPSARRARGRRRAGRASSSAGHRGAVCRERARRPSLRPSVRRRPGTVSSNGNAPAPPTIIPFSRAACMRSIGRFFEKRSMRSSVGSRPKYCPIAKTASPNSSRSAQGSTVKLTRSSPGVRTPPSASVPFRPPRTEP